MEAEKLKGLIDQIADLALDNEQFKHIYTGISHVLSYLKSEQDKRKALADKLDETIARMKHLEDIVDKAEKTSILVDERMKVMHERSEKNGKMLVTVITALIISISIQLLKIAFSK